MSPPGRWDDPGSLPRRRVADRWFTIDFRTELAGHAVATFALRIAYVGLEFMCVLVLARFLGAEGYGAYAFAMSVVALLGAPTALGFDRYLVRAVATLRALEQWELMRGLLIRSTQVVGAVSCALAILIATAVALLPLPLDDDMTGPVCAAMLMVPFVAYARLRQATLQGLNRVVVGQVPETVVQPVTVLILVIVGFVVTEMERSALNATMLNVVAAAVAGLTGALLLRNRLPAEVAAATPRYETRSWMAGARPFVTLLAFTMALVNADVVLLGLLANPEATGVYRVASQMATFVAFPLTAINLAVAPAIASLYAKREVARLQRKATGAARAALIASVPIAAGLVVLGPILLPFFGAGFVQGQWALAILSAGYVVNASAGSAGYLLIMTRFEREAGLAFAAAALANVALCFLLIPRWGIEGAATATALAISLLSIVLIVLSRRLLGIRATCLGGSPTLDARTQAEWLPPGDSTG